MTGAHIIDGHGQACLCHRKAVTWQGGGVQEGDKGHTAVGNEFGHPAVTGKPWITIFVMHQARFALGWHLYGGATIGSHGPQVATAIPQKHFFEWELQT